MNKRQRKQKKDYKRLNKMFKRLAKDKKFIKAAADVAELYIEEMMNRPSILPIIACVKPIVKVVLL